MDKANHIRIKNANVDLVSALDKTMGSVLTANADLRAAKSAEIQKRGFTYPGDKHNAWGLGGSSFGLHGSTGFIGGAPFYGRGLELQLRGFSLQPFGLGVNGILSGAGLSPSLFAGSGAAIRFNRTTHIARLKMALCVEAYKGFGIVKNVIDLMCNFASEGVTVLHASPAIQRFYQRWFEAVGMEERIKTILRYYYKYGNCFIYTIMGIIDEFTYKKMKSTRGGIVKAKTRDTDIVDTNDPDEKTRGPKIQKEKNKPISEREIPWRYVLLNPFQMDRIGNKFFGQSEWIFVLSEETRKDIEAKRKTANVDVLDETDIGLPPEFKTLNKDGNAIKLDQDKLWTLQYMRDDHEDWADPMVWPVMNDIMYKNNLRAMDMSVVNSTINAITIFKLGDIKNGFVAPNTFYQKLSEMLRTPTYSHNIIWNDAIQMESNYPPIEKILSIDKYRSVDRDILAGLGIPGILVNGVEGGSFANAFLQVRTLLERLEEGRREVMRWLKKQLRIVAEIMGHRQIPIVKFGSMSLKDEQAEKKLIVQLLDRNIISAERVHEVFGIETTIELERMRREMKLAEDEELMVKFGPFKDPMNLMDAEEMMGMEQDNEMERLELQKRMQMQQRRQQNGLKSRPNKKGPSGRPPGSNTPQEKKRDTKPKGMGLGQILDYEILRDKASAHYEFVEKYLTSLTLKSRGVSYWKSLSKEDKKNLENLITVVFSNIGIDEELTESRLNALLENPIINDKFDALYKLFANMAVKELTAEKRRFIKATVWAATKGDLNAIQESIFLQ